MRNHSQEGKFLYTVTKKQSSFWWNSDFTPINLSTHLSSLHSNLWLKYKPNDLRKSDFCLPFTHAQPSLFENNITKLIATFFNDEHRHSHIGTSINYGRSYYLEETEE